MKMMKAKAVHYIDDAFEAKAKAIVDRIRHAPRPRLDKIQEIIATELRSTWNDALEVSRRQPVG